jgi:GTPase
MDTIKNLIKSPAVKRTAIMFDENTPMDDIDKWSSLMHGNTIVPIFSVSSVTGIGLR